ncbi:MAG: Co2+/Mg2+ efflux protein ApaG [Bacteroidota bacterium]
MGMLTTKGITISVKTRYHQEHSEPARHKYIFSYRVNIKNESDHSVQLLRRHWFIFDSNGIRREVEGEGVIDQQPILHPGESYEYLSWCPLLTGIGRMWGTYLMQRQADGEEFRVRIPEFQLIVPAFLN